MGKDEDKDEAKLEDLYMEDDEKDNEDAIWVRMRIRVSMRISIWSMMRKTMRMRYG